jgi:acyl-CoA thioesterase FadM
MADSPGGRRFTTQIQLRWGDMDAMAHMNNAAIVTLLEEARVRLFAELAAGRGSTGFSLVAARHEIDYLRPILYSTAPVEAAVWIDRIGTSSFTVGAELLIRSAANPDDGTDGGDTGIRRTAAVRGRTVVVAVSPQGAATPLPDAAREALRVYLPE